MKRNRRSGFTLIEICLAVAIALIMLMIAIPSISGVLSQKKTNQPFDTFDQMVKTAQSRSLSEGRPYCISWEKGEIVLRPTASVTKAEANGVERISLSDQETYSLELPAAMVKKAPMMWVFWPTGTWEAATVTYKGPDTAWKAIYRPLKSKAEVAEL
jgi:prepilin-type N-terminal cleavage/methylation domain-containing protein